MLAFTFYWKVVPVNLAGAATGCPVWSFQQNLGYLIRQYPDELYPESCDGVTENEIHLMAMQEYSVVSD